MSIPKFILSFLLGILKGFLIFSPKEEVKSPARNQAKISELTNQIHQLKDEIELQKQLVLSAQQQLQNQSLPLQKFNHQLEKHPQPTQATVVPDDTTSSEQKQRQNLPLEFKDINALNTRDIKQFWKNYINHESRDEQWAQTQEETISQFVETRNSDGKLQIAKIQCKSQSCLLNLNSYQDDNSWINLVDQMKHQSWWHFDHSALQVHTFGNGEKGIQMILTTQQAIQQSQTQP